MARRITGAEIIPQGYHLLKMFSAEEFSNLACNAAEEVWLFLSKLRQMLSVIGALYFICLILS